MNAAKVVEDLKQRFPNEPEYIQAVSQVLPTIAHGSTIRAMYRPTWVIASSTTTLLARTKAVSVITRA